MSAAALRAPLRDPAWLGRVFWLGAALVVLWPMGVATEFKPWLLLAPDSRSTRSNSLSARSKRASAAWAAAMSSG